MAKPDIRILVGNKGDAAANGASAVLIRTNLEKALSSGIKIKVSLDSASTKTLKTQINQLSQQKHTLETDSATNAQKRNADATRKATEEQLRRNKALADGSLALSRFNSYLQTVNPKGLTQFSTQIASIRGMLSSSDPLKMKAAVAETNELKAAMKSAGYEGGNVFTYLGSKIKTFATYLASSVLTMGVINGVRNIISTVKELDGALTDLRIVTGGTKAETQELLAVYNQMAQELGSTTQSVASAAVNWQRQGYSLADTNKLLKDSMVLSIVGAMDSAEATTALTAALKGYKLEVDDASSVVDKFFAVDMNAATSSSKMAIALSKTAANAKLAELSLDDVIGQLAQVNSVMQEGGEQTGTFYNTMLSRMANIKAGRLEDPEDGESLSDVETTLNGLGIKLRDTNSEFRNFGDVLEDVGEKWESFSSVQKRAVATAFSGTRQQTRFLALMDNWDKAQEYSEVAANSAGVSLDKFGAYEESVEAKTNRMTAAFENFSTTLLDSGFIGFFLDLGTALFNAGAAFDAWPIKLALLATAVVGAVTAFKAFKTSSIGLALSNTLSIVPNMIANLNAVGTVATLAATNVKVLGSAFSSMTAAQIANTAVSKGMSEAQLLVALSYSTLDKEVKKEVVSQFASAAAKNANTAAGAGQAAGNSALTISWGAVTTAIWANVKAIGAWLLTNPVGWIISLVGAIGISISAVTAHNKSLDEAAEKANELESSYRDAALKIKGDIDSLSGIEAEFDSLSKGVDKYGKNVSLSADEYKHYQEIIAQVISLSPMLASGYDNEGNALAEKNGLVEKSIKLMQEEQRLRLESQVSDDNFLEIAKGKRAALESFTNKSNYIESSGVFADQAISDITDIFRTAGQYTSAQLLGLADAFEADSSDFDLLLMQNFDQIARAVNDNWDQIVTLLGLEEANHLNDLIERHQKNFSTYQREFEKLSTALNPTLQLVPQTVTEYQGLSDAQKAFISDYINGFRTAKDANEDDFLQMKQDVLDFTDTIANSKDLQDTVNKLFMLDPDKMMVSDYDDLSAQVDVLISDIEKALYRSLTDEQMHSIRLALGLDVVVTDKDGNEVNEKDYLVKTAEEKIKHQLEYSMQRDYELGNVDLTLRPRVELDDGSYATVLSQWKSYFDPNGNEVGIHVTPILQDGTILSDNELQDYIEKCIESGDALEYDKTENGGKGVILHIVPKIDGQSEGDFVAEGNKWDIALHDIQDQYYDIGRYIDELTMEELRALPLVDLSGAKDWEDILHRIQEYLKNASEYAVDLSDATELFGSSIEKIQKLQNLMDSLKDGGSGSLTADFLTDLFELLPEVAGKVNSVQEAQEALTSAIDETKTTAQNAYGTMLIANQDWLSAAVNGSASLQSALVSYYKNDVKNWKSSAETKWKVDSALVGDLSSLWSKYMGMSVEKIESTVALLEDLSISYGLSDRDDTTLREMKAYLALLKSLNVEFDSINWSPPSSSGSKKSVDEYRASIDALYESTVRLNDLQNEMSTLEAKRDQLDTEDYRKKIAYSQEIIRLRGEENKILHEQNEIRRREIQGGVDRLTGLGFQIEYTPGANDLLIKNLEHINELVAPSGKIEDTNELRKSAEKLAETIMDLNDDAADASLSWHENLVDLKQDIDSLTDAMGDYFSEWEDVKKHQLNLMENQGGQTSEMIAEYYTMMDEAHRVAEEVRGTLRDAGFSEAEIEASSAVRDLESAWWDYYHSIQELQQDRLDALNEELDLVKQMIKQEKEDEIDALEKQKDAYSDLIELKKRSLELTERGRGHDEQVNALNKELAKLQGRADTLKLAAASGDRQAALELGSVQEQIMAKQKELSDLQRDYSIENQKDALDQEKQDFEDTQDKKIQDIKDFLADNQRLTQAALDRIEQSGSALFDELSVYASKYTNTTSQQLQKMWDDATEAARGYQSFTEALNQTTQEAYRPSTNGGNTGDSSISDAYIISRMQHNGALWHNADQKTRAELEKENTKLARQLGLDPDKDRRNGRWYWPNSEIPVYHTGGIVGSEITPGQKELLLMAQTGEFIATEKQQKNISSLLKQGEENTGVVGMIRGLIANMTARPSAERPKQDVQFNFTVYAEDGNDFIRQIEGRKREIANILLATV